MLCVRLNSRPSAAGHSGVSTGSCTDMGMALHCMHAFVSACSIRMARGFRHRSPELVCTSKLQVAACYNIWMAFTLRSGLP